MHNEVPPAIAVRILDRVLAADGAIWAEPHGGGVNCRCVKRRSRKDSYRNYSLTPGIDRRRSDIAWLDVDSHAEGESCCSRYRGVDQRVSRCRRPYCLAVEDGVNQPGVLAITE